MTQPEKTIRVQTPWLRRQWLKVTAFMEDHPRISVGIGGLLLAAFLFYGIRLGGFAHFRESASRWRVETFGGAHQVDRSVRISDVILSFQHRQYNKLDVVAMTAVNLKGNAFREELREIAAEPEGHIRIVALDPRLGEPGHPEHEKFVALAEAFGQKQWEYRARAWHSASVLLHLRKELGDAIEIRFLSTPSKDANPPFITAGRSGHLYFSTNPKKRLDVVVPRPDEPDGNDSFAHPGTVYIDRQEDGQVVKFTAQFKELWEKATPLDDALQNELLQELRGENPPGS